MPSTIFSSPSTNSDSGPRCRGMLLVGSVWAKSAWGDYWVWDPTESWSLVTWLVYGVYLHMRHVRGGRGSLAAWLAIGGFAVVLFGYLGMAALPTAAEGD